MSPAFDPSVTSYTAETTNATNAVTAEAAEGSVSLKVNGQAHTSGTAATWTDGANTVEATVTNGGATKTYTVTVTKEA